MTVWGQPAYPRPRGPLRTLALFVAVVELGAAALFGPMTLQAHRLALEGIRHAGQQHGPADGSALGGLLGGRDHGKARRHRITTTRAHGCDPAPDLRAPKLDARVRDALERISERWSVRVSCVHTGHSQYVKGTTRTSNHYLWRAVDLDMVSGHPVGPGNPAAKALARWLGGLHGRLAPAEVGSPWTFGGAGPWFSDDGHQGHLHVGYGAG